MHKIESIEYYYRRTYGIGGHKIIYWKVGRHYCVEHEYLENGVVVIRDANWHRHSKRWLEKDREYWERHAKAHNNQDYRN